MDETTTTRRYAARLALVVTLAGIAAPLTATTAFAGPQPDLGPAPVATIGPAPTVIHTQPCTPQVCIPDLPIAEPADDPDPDPTPPVGATDVAAPSGRTSPSARVRPSKPPRPMRV